MPITTSSAFSYDKLDHSRKNSGHLMVTLDAPERDFDRTPLCAVLVLDVSTSMGSQMTDGKKSKIQGLKEVARCLVQQLSTKDEVAIVAYSSTSEIVLERVSVKDKNTINAAIDNLRLVGCTNIGAGLIDGFKCINDQFSGVKRVFLVSDGQNNTGMDNDQLKNLVKGRGQYSKDVAVSTFGVGTDCDQEMMADLAKMGEGNYYFISDSADMKKTFARELGGALACDVQNIEITIRPNNGNKVEKVLNDFSVEDKKGVAVIKAEDLYVGETRHILVEMSVSEVEHPKPRKVSVARVEVEYYDVKQQKTCSDEHNVKVQFVTSDKADKEEKLEIREQVALLKVADAALKAVEYANMGDFAAAQGAYGAALHDVDELVAAGSEVCSFIQDDAAVAMSNFSEANYSAEIGARTSSDSSGMMKCRATRGMSAKLYSTQSTDAMEAAFDNVDGLADEVNPFPGIAPAPHPGSSVSPPGIVQPIAPAPYPGPSVSPPVIPPPPVAPVKRPRKPEKEGFSKKRSDRIT